MTNEDTEAIRRQLPEVEVIAPRNQLRGYRGGNNVTRGTKSGNFSVMGDHPEIRVIRAVRIARGRFLNPYDLQEKRKVAVVGTRVVELLFDEGEDPIGEEIRINGVYFKVVGLFRPSESGEDGSEEARTIHLPFTTFQQAFNYGNIVGWYAITSRADLPASVAEEEVLALLKERHRVHPEDQRAFGHFNLEEEFEQVQGLFISIRMLIWIVGIGTLAAGVIGVSNIMLVIVRERTNEIGIRRAVGATPLAIMSHVILEAIILTSVAGYLGMTAGIWLVEGVDMMLRGQETGMFANPEVSSVTAVKALVILSVSGVLAGVIPARRAVKVKPVEALRAI